MTKKDAYEQARILRLIKKEEGAQPEHYLPEEYKPVSKYGDDVLYFGAPGFFLSICFYSYISFSPSWDVHYNMKHTAVLFFGTALLFILSEKLAVFRTRRYKKHRASLLKKNETLVRQYVEFHMELRGVKMFDIGAELQSAQDDEVRAKERQRLLEV